MHYTYLFTPLEKAMCKPRERVGWNEEERAWGSQGYFHMKSVNKHLGREEEKGPRPKKYM